MSENILQEISKQQLTARMQEQEALAAASTAYKKYVCFMLNDREYAVDIDYVQEITEIFYIRKIIFTPEFLVGVINLRGAIIAVIDLKQLFNLGVTDLKNKNARLVINKLENKTIAFVVDGIRKIREITNNEVQQPPPTFNEIKPEFIIGMSKTPENTLVVMLNLPEIMNAKEIIQLSGEEIDA